MVDMFSLRSWKSTSQSGWVSPLSFLLAANPLTLALSWRGKRRYGPSDQSTVDIKDRQGIPGHDPGSVITSMAADTLPAAAHARSGSLTVLWAPSLLLSHAPKGRVERAENVAQSVCS